MKTAYRHPRLLSCAESEVDHDHRIDRLRAARPGKIAKRKARRLRARDKPKRSFPCDHRLDSQTAILAREAWLGAIRQACDILSARKEDDATLPASVALTLHAISFERTYMQESAGDTLARIALIKELFRQVGFAGDVSFARSAKQTLRIKLERSKHLSVTHVFTLKAFLRFLDELSYLVGAPGTTHRCEVSLTAQFGPVEIKCLPPKSLRRDDDMGLPARMSWGQPIAKLLIAA